MSWPIVFGSLAVASSVPLLWWAVASTRRPEGAALSNLSRGMQMTDLRELVLARSANERAVRPAVAALSRLGGRFTPAGMVRRLDRRITLAGRPHAWPLERVLAAKFVLGAGGLAAGTLRFLVEPTGRSLLLALALVAAGYLVPDVLLSTKAKARQQEIRLKLPDTLDQLTICVEAGLGFEAAMSRVGRTGDGPIADEFVRTLQEMQIGATRADALRALATRTEVTELRRFVLAMLQAESYGMPVADVLRTQAAELRVKRRQRAEEHAMKIPVKIIFPLVLCILPALFIVILGPGAIRMMRFFTTGQP
jgi:tight adherence protein C